MPKTVINPAAGVQADLEKCLQRLSPEDTIEEFPLGEADYANRLRFPQKLYGRDRELKELESAFESVCRDTSSIVFVGGYSGIGKTALVEEIQRPVSEKSGYFIEGKFDQYLRTTPYSGITQAFAQFVSQILTEPERAFKEWQVEILVGGWQPGQGTDRCRSRPWNWNSLAPSRPCRNWVARKRKPLQLCFHQFPFGRCHGGASAGLVY